MTLYLQIYRSLQEQLLLLLMQNQSIRSVDPALTYQLTTGTLGSFSGLIEVKCCRKCSELCNPVGTALCWSKLYDDIYTKFINHCSKSNYDYC
jgi:hypothetical protein